MATGKFVIDEGTTTNIATNTLSEDAVTKHIGRSVLNNSSGTEIATSANPLQVSLANTGTNATAVKVDGSAVTQPISVASIPSHAVTNAGTFAVQVSSALPAGTNGIGKLTANSGVDIGDVDVTSLPALAAGTNNIGDVDVLTLPAIPAGTNLIGYVGHGKTLKSKTGTASATFTVIAAVTSKKIKVYSLSLITASATAVTITFKDGASGTAVATYPLQAITGTNFGITENVAVPSQLFETTAATLLEMAFSAAQSVTYNIRYWDDDAT